MAGGSAAVLTITKLVSAEYLISSVAERVEDYFMGAGKIDAALDDTRVNACLRSPTTTRRPST